MVVGSVRRERPVVHDIDIVLEVENPLDFQLAMNQFGAPLMNGPKIKRVNYKGQMVDIYLANEETWATLVLIRTGSKEHNKKLCYTAQTLGMKLAASGDGLFDKDGKRIAGDTEASIFEALGVPYKVPQYRN
jgi:DNA polymerase (family 10)